MRPFPSLAGALVLTIGCAGSTATITRPDGPPIEGRIESSDAETLRVRTPDGNVLSLDQYAVSDVDHPGNVLATIGLGYAAGSAILFFPPALRHPQPADGAGTSPRVLAFIGLAAVVEGLAIFTYNIAVWAASKRRARAFERERPPAWLLPPPAPELPAPPVFQR
jgi:hypothetical protein